VIAAASYALHFYRRKLYNRWRMAIQSQNKHEVMMKYLCQLLVAALLLSLYAGCAFLNDVPRHTADEVITIAKSFSSDCRVQVGTEEPCG